MIVIDASVLIAHFYAGDAHHEHAEKLLLEAAVHDLGASSVTLAEVLVGPTRAGRLGEARTALRDSGVEELPLPWGAAERLASLRVDSGLTLADCCVLLAAQDVVADAVLTFDDRLAKAASSLGFASAVPRVEEDADADADVAGVDASGNLGGDPDDSSGVDGTQ